MPIRPNPAQSGPCVWPAHDDEPVHGEGDLKAAINIVEEIATTEGRECGEYAPGTTIWYTIWDEDETIAHSGTVTI